MKKKREEEMNMSTGLQPFTGEIDVMHNRKKNMGRTQSQFLDSQVRNA